jgi:multiple antibiotic resistance protein
MAVDYLRDAGGLFISSFIALFVIVSPLGNVFTFLSLTQGYDFQQQRQVARQSCGAAFLLLSSFLFVGQALLNFFGITLSAFQIAGGLLLFWISLDMLGGETSHRRDTTSGLKAGEYHDISLIPLAIPLLGGPGAITTTLMLANKAGKTLDMLILLLALASVMTSAYLCFLNAARLSKVLGRTGIRFATSLMGLLLAALAVQFLLDGIRRSFMLPGP